MPASGDDEHDKLEDSVAHEIEVRVEQGIDGDDHKIQTPRLSMPDQLLSKVPSPPRPGTEMDSEDGVDREPAQSTLQLATSKQRLPKPQRRETRKERT